MPIFEYRCDECQENIEIVNGGIPSCCNIPMRKLLSFPVMVKIKGEGGYPSRRKLVKGTAPGTTRQSKAWLGSDPYESTRKAQSEGQVGLS